MTTTNLAAQSLQRQIANGAWQPGQMLPGQRELAEQMSISRATLREALSMLEALGLVRSMPGKGTLVTHGGHDPGPSYSSSALAPIDSTHTQALQQLWQFRFCIDPASAALAARNMLPDQASDLWAVQARMEDAVRKNDMGTARAADLEFHQHISALSGNAHLQEVLSSFDFEIGRAIAIPFIEKERIQEVLHEHRAIAAAICVGDADGAREAMQEHLRNSARSLGFDFVEP